MLRILAVTMLDYKLSGSDQFFVQVSDNTERAVVIYRAYVDGRVKVVRPPAPLSSVASAVEKFNAGYYVQDPVELQDIGELPKYVGKFEFTENRTVKLKLS